MTSITKKIQLVSLLLILSISTLHAERIAVDGFGLLSVDYPEGFVLADADDKGTSFYLCNQDHPVDSILRIYTDNRYKTTEDALKDTVTKLGSNDILLDNVTWRNQKCAIATFTSTINNARVSGYGVSVTLPGSKSICVLIAWTAEKMQEKYNPFLVSILDSLCIDMGSYTEQGIMTKYLFPSQGGIKKITLDIDGETIFTSIKENDSEASDYVIEREYNILTMYANNKNWQEAWKRYYRMIYRDTYGRLTKVSFDVYNSLNPKSKDDTDLAQKILTWVQGFKYERNRNSSDFTCIPSILQGESSDCDSRSILTAVLLNSWNIDTIIMVSNVYSHAMPAITSNHKGHSFRFNGKDYLMGETTTKGLTWGKIASNQDKIENWIFVDF